MPVSTMDFIMVFSLAKQDRVTVMMCSCASSPIPIHDANLSRLFSGWKLILQVNYAHLPLPEISLLYEKEGKS